MFRFTEADIGFSGPAVLQFPRMFENLSDKLNRVLRFLKGEVKLTEGNIEQALREIRMALLEGDVNFRVARKFTDEIKQRLLGTEVQESLNPYQQVVKIVHQQLQEILGSESRELAQAPRKPTVIMLVGLQGSGKTTTAGKLALYLKNLGKTSLLCSLDLKRLAAAEQLEIIAGEVGVNFFKSDEKDIQALAEQLKRSAAEYGYDYLITDTAGRLHIDDELMDELKRVKAVLQPAETVFVADSLSGQDAVNSAALFSEKIGIDSIILTKLDADSRGGAALSIVSVTGKPIKFIGIGEKSADFQKFHPERLASKILGMGDMLTLIEKAEKEFDRKEAETSTRKMLENEFTLDDFAVQLKQMQKLGSISDIVGMLPKIGMGMGRNLNNVQVDERRMVYMLAIIQSMTGKERQNPKIVDGRRRLRIARGSGRPVQEINQLLKNFQEMKKYLKKPFFRKMVKKFDNIK